MKKLWLAGLGSIVLFGVAVPASTADMAVY